MSSNEDSKWYLSWESENAWNLDTHFVAEEAFYLFTSLKLNFSSAIFQSWEPFQATKAGIFSDKSSHHRRKKVSEWHENAQLHATYQSIINLSTRIFCKTLQVKKKKKMSDADADAVGQQTLGRQPSYCHPSRGRKCKYLRAALLTQPGQNETNKSCKSSCSTSNGCISLEWSSEDL